MTDDDACGLLLCLKNVPCPVVSFERRQKAMEHALQAIEDRAEMVREQDAMQRALLVAFVRHMRDGLHADPASIPDSGDIDAFLATRQPPARREGVEP